MKKSLIIKRFRAFRLIGCFGAFFLLLTILSNYSAWAQSSPPIIPSITPMVNQRVVTRFNLANFERIRQNRTALSCLYMQECEPGCQDFGGGGDVESTVRGQTCSPCGPCATSCLPCVGGGSLWFHNYGDFVTQQERHGFFGYHADSYGLSLGYDVLKSPGSVFGVAVGGAFSDAKARKSDEKTDTDSFLVSLYGETTVYAWNLLGSIGYVHSAFETNRQSLDDGTRRLQSRHHGETMFGSFEISSDAMNFGGITPFLAYDFIRMKENAYGEAAVDGGTLDDALSVGKRRSTSYLQTLGLRYERSYYDAGGWLVQPSASIGWLHDYGQRRITTTGALNGDGFSYKGTVMGKNRLVMNLGVRATLDNRTTLFIRYDGEYNYRYNAQTVQFGLGLGY